MIKKHMLLMMLVCLLPTSMIAQEQFPCMLVVHQEDGRKVAYPLDNTTLAITPSTGTVTVTTKGEDHSLELMAVTDINYQYHATPEAVADKNLLNGDADGTGSVNIIDALAIVDNILGKPSDVFYDFAADANNDGIVNISDAVAVVDIFLSAAANSRRLMRNAIPFAMCFSSGDEQNWTPWQDVTITYNKDDEGRFWQTISSDGLEDMRLPIGKSDKVTFCDTQYLQVAQHSLEFKNSREYDDRCFEVQLKSNIGYGIWMEKPEWIDHIGSPEENISNVYTYKFAYDENYTGEERKGFIRFWHEESGLKDSVEVISKSDPKPTLTVSPKEVTVFPKQFGRSFSVELTCNYDWMYNDVIEKYIDGEGLLDGGNNDGNIYSYDYAENYTGKDLTAKIVFMIEKYNLTDTVTVRSVCGDYVDVLPDNLPDRWVRAQKRSYNLIGIGSKYAKDIPFGMVLRTGGIKQQEDIGCKILDGGEAWLELGPITMMGCNFSYKRNEGTEVKKARVVLYDKVGEYSDTVTVYSHPISFQHVNDQNYIFIQPDGDEIDFVLYGGAGQEVTPEMEDNIFTDSEILNSASGNYVDFIHCVSSEVVGNDLHFKLRIDPNPTDEHRWQYVNFPVRYMEGCQKLYIGQAPKSAPSSAQMRQALTDLYNATNGPNWYRGKNWNTTLPLSQWEHLGGAGLGDYVWGFDLGGNTLQGTIPESFGSVMEIENTWRIDHNGLYGRIPDAVIDHPKWKEKGWNVVVQDLFLAEHRLLEYDDLKLTLPTYQIDHVNGDLTTSDQLFAKNKVNVVMIGTPSEQMANLHLSYHNKGYGTIVSAYGWLGGDRTGPEQTAKEFPIRDLDYVWDCEWADHELFGLRTMGTWYVFDDKANLLACYVRDWNIPEDWYVAKVDSICRKFLGEPEEHEAYMEYTSTDFSMDGKVKRLQKATKGKGIDIIFVGECFIDKDMDEGGVYDQQMAEAVEQFFSEEPYTSLRNRFNVWQVKAVSKKEAYGDKANHAIQESDERAFAYAQKALGDDADLMMVNVIYKNAGTGASLDVNRSYTHMYYGSYVAYNMQGGRIINHEGGGHGFAFLADEYVEGGNEDAEFGEGDREQLDLLWTTYGYGANVDWRNTAKEVKWNRFISDDRYTVENIGLYEGAHLTGHGCYRPTENSMMRYNDCGFNAPSREAIYKRVMQLSEGDTWEYDYDAFVTFDQASQAAARRKAPSVRRQMSDVSHQPSLPPTLYKGSWREAGHCDPVRLNP